MPGRPPAGGANCGGHRARPPPSRRSGPRAPARDRPFREATLLATAVPKDGTGPAAADRGLLAIEADLRTRPRAWGPRMGGPTGHDGQAADGRRDLKLADEYGDRAHRPGDDLSAGLVAPAGRTRKACGSFALRWRWLTPRQCGRRFATWFAAHGGLDADRAVRKIGQWVAVADAPLLSRRPTRSLPGSGPMRLARPAVAATARPPGARAVVDHGGGRAVSTPIAGDVLEAVRTQVADALVGDAAPPLQDAIRRLLDTDPAVSDALDRAVLEALSRRASAWTWRATG